MLFHHQCRCLDNRILLFIYYMLHKIPLKPHNLIYTICKSHFNVSNTYQESIYKRNPHYKTHYHIQCIFENHNHIISNYFNMECIRLLKLLIENSYQIPICIWSTQVIHHILHNYHSHIFSTHHSRVDNLSCITNITSYYHIKYR